MTPTTTKEVLISLSDALGVVDGKIKMIEKGIAYGEKQRANPSLMSLAKRRIDFEIITYPKDGGQLIFYTKAVNGREALKRMVSKSSDFNSILGKRESNNMTITIKTCAQMFKEKRI